MKRWHWPAIGILVVLVGGGIGLQLYANQTATKRVEAAFASAEAHDVKITHEGVRYSLMDGQVTVSRMVLAPIEEEGSPIKIDEMVIREIDDAEDVPAFADISIRGVQLTGETFGKGFSEGLKQLEYGDLRADLDLAYRFSEDRTEIKVDPVRLSIPQVADLECRLHLGNLAPIETAHPSVVAGFPTWKLHSLDLEYADQSLAPRMMAAFSKQNGIDAKEIIQSTIDQILKSGPPPAIAEGLAQAHRFVGNPGTLTLNAAPKEPMPLQQVVFPDNPLLLLDTLGITLKAG